jgi:hypothetical protein
MGGFVRAISKAVFGTPSQPPVVQTVQPAPVAQTPEPTDKTTRQKLMGSGYGGQTIMTSASGVEDEANTQKTILGGGRKRKINA